MLTKRRWNATTVALTMALGCENAGDETAEEGVVFERTGGGA